MNPWSACITFRNFDSVSKLSWKSTSQLVKNIFCTSNNSRESNCSLFQIQIFLDISWLVLNLLPCPDTSYIFHPFLTDFHDMSLLVCGCVVGSINYLVTPNLSKETGHSIKELVVIIPSHGIVLLNPYWKGLSESVLQNVFIMCEVTRVMNSPDYLV